MRPIIEWESPILVDSAVMKKFRHAWASVWKEIPMSCKRALNRYWRLDEPRNVVLSIGDLGEGFIAVASDYGATIPFDFRWLRLLRDSEIDFTLAHELAHCYLYAIGSSLEAKDEYLANTIAEEWGFQSDSQHVCEVKTLLKRPSP